MDGREAESGIMGRKEGRMYGQMNGDRYVWRRLSVLPRKPSSIAAHWQLRLLGPDAKSVSLGSQLPCLASICPLSRLSEWRLRAADARGSLSSSPTCHPPPRAPALDSRSVPPQV